MTSKVEYDNPSVGCYVDESAGSADDCNRRTIEFAEDYGFNPELDLDPDSEAESEDYSQNLSEAADSAVEFLNDLETRSFLSWQFEDNSLFLLPDVDGAKEDVGFVSGQFNQDYPPADYRGEWLHVNDHGNCTLYVRGEDGNDVEVWSVV